MKCLIFLIYALLIAILCANQPKTGKAKTSRDHIGIDPELQVYVDDYVDRAKARGFEFKHSITVGFKTINEGAVIGLCTYNKQWREVDIDVPFWESARFKSRMVLVFHELTHCLCSRGHDYGEGKEYPNSFVRKVIDNINFQIPYRAAQKPGYYEDGCALSIMTPTIEDESCIQAHEEDYMKEMLDRCNPY